LTNRRRACPLATTIPARATGPGSPRARRRAPSTRVQASLHFVRGHRHGPRQGPRGSGRLASHVTDTPASATRCRFGLQARLRSWSQPRVGAIPSPTSSSPQATSARRGGGPATPLRSEVSRPARGTNVSQLDSAPPGRPAWCHPPKGDTRRETAARISDPMPLIGAVLGCHHPYNPQATHSRRRSGPGNQSR
jgi:hypothetical protein